MMFQPLVSIITPCYNYGRYIGETLESLINQTYQNWECIIINDGSTDDTEEVVNSFIQFDNRFKYIAQKNRGLPSARNTALKVAKGKYVQLLDADDFLEKDKISLQVAVLETNNNIDFVYSGMLGFSNNLNDRVFVPFKLANHLEISGKNEVMIDALINDTFFLPGCVIFKRTLFEKVGGFNETLYGLEDWEYWSRIALSGGEFYWDDRPGTRLMVRDHDSNMSKVREKMLLSRLVARQSIIDTIDELSSSKKMTLSKKYLVQLTKKHAVLLNKEIYEYNISYGNKVFAIKSLLKYSYKSGQFFYPITKFFTAIVNHFKYKNK